MSDLRDDVRRACAEANTLGRRLEAAGRVEDAARAYRAALEIDPDYPAAASNLARLLTARERPRDAVRLLERIAAAAPFDVGLAVNYANALLGVGRAREAEQRLLSVAGRADAPAQAHNSLGIARYVQRNHAAAAESFARAIRAAPDFAEAHENLAQTLLQLGRYEEAWVEYEWRWRNPANTLTKRAFAEPMWDGRPLAGRTLLLHAEQGLGDTIQFARYAALVPKDRGRIVLACQETLAPLFAGLTGVDEVGILGGSLPPFDCHAPLLSLPRLLGTAAATIPDPSPYLTAAPDPEIAAAPGVKIGINWAGRPQHGDDPHRNRSCDIGHFVELVHIGSSLYSLQLGNTAPPPIVDLGERVAGFAATARIVMALDLVVTVDTSIAHLAAALGKPTWVLLPYSANWRWRSVKTADGRRSPWYRSIRLFRQHAPGDWLDVFDRLGQALRTEIRGITNK